MLLERGSAGAPLPRDQATRPTPMYRPVDQEGADGEGEVDYGGGGGVDDGASPSTRAINDPDLETQGYADSAMVGSEGAEGGAGKGGVLTVAMASASAYALTYCWRYPVFILPASVSGVHVMTLGGHSFDLQGCLSVAFTVGFGVGKVPAMALVTSPLFFRHRLKCILLMLVSSAAIEGLGVWLFSRWAGGCIVRQRTPLSPRHHLG